MLMARNLETSLPKKRGLSLPSLSIPKKKKNAAKEIKVMDEVLHHPKQAQITKQSDKFLWLSRVPQKPQHLFFSACACILASFVRFPTQQFCVRKPLRPCAFVPHYWAPVFLSYLRVISPITILVNAIIKKCWLRFSSHPLISEELFFCSGSRRNSNISMELAIDPFNIAASNDW